MEKSLPLTLAFCAAVASNVNAEPFTGNGLLDSCRNGGMVGGFDYCLGYITGAVNGQFTGGLRVFDGLTDRDPSQAVEEIERFIGYCLPPEATKLQVRDIVVNYLSDEPQYRHFGADLLVLLALAQAFPCK